MIYLYLLLAAVGGYLLGVRVNRGFWRKVENPKPHQDRAHYWTVIDRAPRAFTAEQLQVAGERASYIDGRSDYYPPL